VASFVDSAEKSASSIRDFASVKLVAVDVKPLTVASSRLCAAPALARWVATVSIAVLITVVAADAPAAVDMSTAFTPSPAAFMETKVMATVSPALTPVWMSNVPAAFKRLVPLKSMRPAMSFGTALFAAASGPALLGSVGFRGGALAFKASRIDPLAGLKRIFSLHGLIELVKSIAKTLLVASIGYWLLARHLGTLFRLGAMSTENSAAALGGLFATILAALAGGLVAIALIDVPAQVFQRNRRLRMSKEEVREDLKQADGSPEMKRAIRQRQHEVLSGSARKAVREATVVLTNPTHFAIALRYRPMKDAAPVVVARGRGETAQAIKALARHGSVPLLEYPQLARAIYFTSRAGQSVAEDLYVAVATVLAFVFRIDRSLAQGTEQPSVLVPENRRFDENGRPQST